MKEVIKSQELPVSHSQLFVWVFAPHRITEQEMVCRDHCVTDRQELANVFAELGIKWKWQPITFENMHAVIEEVAASNNDYTSVVLNYCDGDEMPEYPGTCVIELLEEKGIIFTGAGSDFSRLCSSKILEKQAFTKAGVPTSPYEVISDINQVQGICDRLGTPLIVKPALSLRSYGISLQSVVFNDEQVLAQVQHLLQGQHGMQFASDSVYVEKFINGSEFGVFLIGSYNQSDRIKIYPPIERVFHSSLPENERFLAFERFWAEPEKSSLLTSEPFCRFELASPDLYEKLCDISKRAYCAVSGNGYGRVDLRMDKASQKLFVLEVNANCGVSSQPILESSFSDKNATTLGNILQLSGIAFSQAILQIIAEAFDRHSIKGKFRAK